MSFDERVHLSCAGASSLQYQDARKLSWKARARSHNSGLDDPLSRAFSEDASFSEGDSVCFTRPSPPDPEACAAPAVKAPPLHQSSSFERLGSALPSKRTHIGSLLLWGCLTLAGLVAVSHLWPARSISHLRLRLTRNIRENGRLAALGVSLATAADTLVVYAYSNSDTEYERNLHFFSRHGMSEGDGCDYVIIVQEGDKLFGSSQLPQLPQNARYVFHENRCFDWGTFGWAIAERKLDISRYAYIIFMNSSVRGPFLPAFWPAGVHWSNVLTTRLNNNVKLVGSTISCEPAWLSGNMSNEKRQIAHVQSYVMATDQVGLDVLRRDGRIFECYGDMADTIFHSELGASNAVLAANFTIDSLMLRYQGVDWTDTANWKCNAGLNPYAEHTYDGVPLNPLEVMFVKVKDFQLEGNWMSTHLAATYGRWLEEQGVPGVINSNDYADHRASYRLAKVLVMQLRGSACFDFEYYRSRSRDLSSWPQAQLWDHFVQDGQFEGRSFRFTCGSQLRSEAVAAAAMRAFSQDAQRIMDVATAAARAAVRPVEAGASAESAAKAASAVAASLPSVETQEGALPGPSEPQHARESGAGESADATASAAAHRHLLA